MGRLDGLDELTGWLRRGLVTTLGGKVMARGAAGRSGGGGQAVAWAGNPGAAATGLHCHNCLKSNFAGGGAWEKCQGIEFWG